MSSVIEKAGITVSLRDIRREFPGGVRAIEKLSFDIPAGQFLALLGPSGCGKSTLLRIIAGLDKPTSGALQAGPSGPGLAYVFQDAHLLPWRTVLQNVALPLELRHIPTKERKSAATIALEQVGLQDSLHRYPAQLSGGMKMRVSLARALVTNPNLLLLDEPFAALDEITRQQLDEKLHELWRSRGMTVIFVTHSIVEAAFLAERAIVFTPRPARIVLDHPIDLPPHRTADLRGESIFAAQTRILLQALTRGGTL